MRNVISTTLVGSYPQPEWLIDRGRLLERLPPRIRAAELWRVDADRLEEAQDDATIAAVSEMERAGVDLVTDGEIRRESYSNHFATSLDGLDLTNPGVFVERNGLENYVPRVVGPVRRTRPVQVREVRLLRSITRRSIKVTVPGPFTMSQQAVNEYYPDERSLALALSVAVNDEIVDLFAAGADVVQIDEPYLQARPEQGRQYGIEAIDRALDGVQDVTALHTCFGYAHYARAEKTARDGYPIFDELNDLPFGQLVLEAAQPRLDLAILERIPDKTITLGVLDLGTERIETPDEVAGRVRAALEHIEPERLMVAPDCGMKFLPRATAFAKLAAMVKGAQRVRDEL